MRVIEPSAAPPGAACWVSSPFEIMSINASPQTTISLLAKGGIDCGAMITNRFKLDDYLGAIDTFLAGGGLKVQVGPGLPAA